MKLAIAGALLAAGADAHSNLIFPKPRNAIDSLLPEWSGGKAPYQWVGGPKPYHPPCVCWNGTEPCESAQTCLWSDPSLLLLKALLRLRLLLEC